MKKTIPIPEGARSISFDFSDTEPEKVSVEEAFDKAEKNGTATTSLHAKKSVQDRTTGLDRLRSIGTPIDLVYTALLAEDFKLATALFRTAVLEYLYAKIEDAWKYDTINFIHSRHMHRKDEKVGIIVEGPVRSIPLTPEFDAVLCNGIQKAFIPAYSIDAGQKRARVADDGNAAVLHLIEDVTSTMRKIIRKSLVHEGIEMQCTFEIVVDLSTFSIKREGDEIVAEASVPVIAYTTYAN
jgi:hypothetical protein